MKKFTCILFLTVIIGSTQAQNTASAKTSGELSDKLVDYLLSRTEPGTPELVDDTVIFTASSAYRRVGIAFAHEGFGKVYWFKKLMIPNENAAPWKKDKPPPDLYRDSGILFHVFIVPETLTGEIEYRLVMDGLWARDPLNPRFRRGREGIECSIAALPKIARPDFPNRGPEGTLNFTFYAPGGETVTVAGTFNNWDPFMYELREIGPGRYTLSLPLPPGTYQYAFFYRGERLLDLTNPNRVYSRDGKAASEATVTSVEEKSRRR
jgi:hypothetical protein